MLKRFAALFAFAVVVTACGSAGSEPVDTALEATTSTSASDTTTPGSPPTSSPVETTSTASDATTTTSDRPVAPDFTLALGEGGSYTLSEGEKPVYLVFWAEW